VDLQCEASLAIDGESGTWSSNDNQQGDCSVAGLFLDTDTTITNPLINIVAYYYQANIMGSIYYTRCAPNTACNTLGILTWGKPPVILWTGVQITIGSTQVCVGASVGAPACAPDPVPGGTPLGPMALVDPPHRCEPPQSDRPPRGDELAAVPPSLGPTPADLPNPLEDR
jgi:hypothetical protein